MINVGVFDSGVGGKLIAEKLDRLNKIRTVYLSDPEYFPYGNKTKKVIRSRLLHFAGLFKSKKCRIVVIACNSATTNGIAFLRQQFPEVAFIGIEPPVKPVSVMTKSGKAAIMGTPATIESDRLKKLKDLFASRIKLYNISCPGLGEYIEEQVIRNIKCCTTFYSDRTAMNLVKKFLDKPVAEGVDTVGIACTHYPYLMPLMKKMYPKVKFYDPADAVVSQIEKAIMIS